MFLPTASEPTKNDYARLVRHCGFGVPNLGRAQWSVSNSLTLIVEEELHPFIRQGSKDPTLRDMQLHRLPWPLHELEELDATEVEMRVTLSYFIEPNPSDRGRSRYRYESHGLRFDVKRPHESTPGFRARVNRADVIILQFPLWWFGLPAILKGWIDRVFASGGRIYGGGKWYDRGVFVGKRAMCSLTIGGPPPIYSERGLNGPIDAILFPINHGMLYFVGFTVIEPFLVHAPARLSDGERAAHLARYRERVLGLASAPTITYPKLADYDESHVLKSPAPA